MKMSDIFDYTKIKTVRVQWEQYDTFLTFKEIKDINIVPGGLSKIETSDAVTYFRNFDWITITKEKDKQ